MSSINQSEILTRHRVTAFFHGAAAPCSNLPGFCKAATNVGIGKHGFVLAPGRYVGAEKQDDDGEPFGEKSPRRLSGLDECFGEGKRLMAVVRENLTSLTDDGDAQG